MAQKLIFASTINQDFSEYEKDTPVTQGSKQIFSVLDKPQPFLKSNVIYLLSPEGKFSMELEEEKQLVERAKNDPFAFGELYDLYYSKIFNYILRRVGFVPDASDIASDVFFKVMRYLAKFEWQEVPFSSWIYKIASNEINSHLRRKRFWFSSLDSLFNDHDFEVADENDLPEDYT